jgi:pimeloyl-ACP methyl ester carboxylesterase
LNTNFISYKSADIFYRVIGKGSPVVLIHGFAEDGEVWKYQTDFLKDHYQLIIPDLPGSGQSAFNDQLSTMDDYAEVIKAILDNEKITNCILIGHSLGGYITLAFEEKYPQLLKAFGLFHSTAFADTEEKKQTRLKAIDFINANGVYNFIKSTTNNLFANLFKKDHPEQIEALIEQGRNFSSGALIQYYRAMIARPDRVHVLKNSTKPVLFIIGEQDNIIPFQSSLQQCHLPAQSHINILANSGHMGMWEETTKANQILTHFLTFISQT